MPKSRAPAASDAAFWFVAATFTAIMAYSTLPTPLYSRYEQADGFPHPVVTVVFAAYAVGVLASLYLAGHVSDWFGRRPVFFVAILIQVVAALVFAIWPELGGLLVGRVVNGIGVGILTATATAYLAELRFAARPGESIVFAASIATAANLGGLGLGPIIGGVFAEWLPDPLHLPHLVFAVLFAIAAVFALRLPETAKLPDPRPRWRPQRISIPRTDRRLFIAAAAAAFTAFAVFGLFGSVVPALLANVLHQSDALVAGVIAGSVFLSACVTQLVFAPRSAVTRARLPLGLVPVGLIAIGAGVLIAQLPLFALGGLIAGAGVGLLFRSSLDTAGELAPAHAKGEGLAAMYLIAYAGLVVPVVATGVALVYFSETTVIVVFLALALIAIVVTGGAVFRHAARARV
jgi:MFS family permease